MPCILCLLLHSSGTSQPPPALPGETATSGNQRQPAATSGNGTADTSLAAAARYHAWDWPASLRRDQVTLELDGDVVALLIPTGPAREITAVLTARRCPPPVLTHPDAPGHRVVLAGEPFGVPLPWPPGVHTATGTLPLPPTMTPRGPVTWTQPPQTNALRLCREIDVFTAARTALADPPPPQAGPSSGRG